MTEKIKASFYNAGDLNGALPDARKWQYGSKDYYQVQIGHRFAFVNAADVNTVPEPAPNPEPAANPDHSSNAVTHPEELANTGSSVGAPLTLALGTLILGTLAVIESRRRRQLGV